MTKAFSSGSEKDGGISASSCIVKWRYVQSYSVMPYRPYFACGVPCDGAQLPL
jgi:hypothetical protein